MTFSLITFKRGKTSKVYVILSKWLFKRGNEVLCFWPGASNAPKFVKQNMDPKTDWQTEEVDVKGNEFGKKNGLNEK